MKSIPTPCTNPYLLEYSFQQKAFHVVELHEALKTNLECLAMNEAIDYIPVFAAPTRELAHAFADKIGPAIRERENGSTNQEGDDHD